MLLQLLGAIAVLLIGIVLVTRRRREESKHRRARAVIGAMLILVIGASVAGISGPMSPAAAACAPAPAAPVNSLTIVQTSTISGLSPTTGPQAITGLVTNNGPDDTFIVAIVASISSVTKAPGAPAGTCDTSDFDLVNAQMAVGVPLAASGGSTTFGGASIGFHNKPTNQDGCKGSTVNLAYTAAP